jgi:hypothetical protein
MTTLQDDLQAIENRLRGRWIQYGYANSYGQLDTCGACLAGAVNWVLTGDPFPTDLRDDVRDRYEDVANALHLVAGGSFVSFNDAWGRTEEEVIAPIRKATGCE